MHILESRASIGKENRGGLMVIHKQTECKRIYKDTVQTSARLCNPYDPDASTTNHDDDVTCKLCLKIMAKKNKESKGRW